MSSFSWIAYSEDERNRTQEIIDQFKGRDTRDELGIGRIQNTFSDLLFPGITTIQTRAKYFLFIPWMFRHLEDEGVSSAEIRERTESFENDLIEALSESHPEPRSGVIGVEAGADLQNYPSSIYWPGLGTFNIRMAEWSKSKYFNQFDEYTVYQQEEKRLHKDEPVAEDRSIWHPPPPNSPDAFPDEASFDLQPEEAAYLNERIQESVEGSLLAEILRIGEISSGMDYPWNYDQYQLQDEVRENLEHARKFSEVIHGADLLYFMMLVEEKQADSPDDESFQDDINRYEQDLTAWAADLDGGRLEAIRDWDREEFWFKVHEHSASNIVFMRRFVEDWIEFVVDEPASIKTSEAARNHIRNRELALKGKGRARLQGGSPLAAWEGGGTRRMITYRWDNAKRQIDDILTGLEDG